MHRRRVSLLSAALFVAAACAPAGTGNPKEAEEERQILQDVVRQQEQEVTAAAARVEKLERKLAAVRLRERLLREYGRPDLAERLGVEEQLLEQQEAEARRALGDEADALAAYQLHRRRRGQRP